MKQKHASIAIFVPHAGCPHQCAFCDQRQISGAQESPTPRQVRALLADAVAMLPNRAKSAQIAFFGGSFTAVPRDYMISLLEAAHEFVDGDNISGIRISTRSDAIDEDILAILKRYGVTDIELGAQSMDDAVLAANGRGHTAEDTVTAARLIQDCGVHLVLQMMSGLYTSTTEVTRNTAIQIVQLKPDAVRIYPTVVLRGTRLETLYRDGLYQPQTLDSAVEEAAHLLEFFTEQGVRVLRLGLHDSPDLHASIVAGPHHPAFRELCESRVLLRNILAHIEKNAISKGKITIFTARGSVSKAAGHKRENLIKLQTLGFDAKIAEDDALRLYEVKIL